MVPLAIVAVIVMFLAVETVIQYVKRRSGEEVYGFFIPDPPEEISEAPENFPRMVASLTDFGIRPLCNQFLHDGHTWAVVEESGEAGIGVDSLARKAIGKIDACELPEVGQTVRQGEKLFTLRQGNRVAEFVAPLEGTITHVKDDISGDMDSSEWICRIQPANLSSNLGALKFAEDGVRWIYEELLRLQDLVVAQIPRLETVGVTMQDGPLALDSLLENLDDETWNMFEQHFLKKSSNWSEEK